MIVLIILGYVLITIISILFILAVMLLFIPFSYLSYGSLDNDQGDATAEFKWLFNAIDMRMLFRLGKAFECDLRIGFLHFRPDFHRWKAKPKKEASLVEKKKRKRKGRFTKDKLIIVLKSLKRILMRYKPRKLMIDATIGFDDAYYTGLMCAGLSSISPLVNLTGSEVRIVPEYNDALFEGCYEAEGRVVVFFLAWEALKIYFSKPFRMKH